MKILQYFSHSDVKIFSEQLVQQLRRDLPPTLIDHRRKALSVNKVTRVLERTYLSVTEYQAIHRVGFIKRAVMANNFKWALKNEGYPGDFVDMATEGLVVAFLKAKNNPEVK